MEHKLFARYPIGNPRRKWKQDNFLLRLSSPAARGLSPQSELTLRKTRRAVKTAIDAGFDLLGCGWAESNLAMEIVRTAERYGGRVLFSDFLRYSGQDQKVFSPTNDFEGAIRDTEKWNSVMGYLLWDEPILPEHLEEVRRMLDFCESTRPHILPYVPLNPDYHKLCTFDEACQHQHIEDHFADVLPDHGYPVQGYIHCRIAGADESGIDQAGKDDNGTFCAYAHIGF